MVGHTLGPWRREQGTTLVWGACGPDDLSTYGMGYPVAECYQAPRHRLAHPTVEEMIANADLCAAAPDLLAALKNLVALFGGYQGLELSQARAAIAKAEDRS